MANRRNGSPENGPFLDGVKARLMEAAEEGRSLDVILAVRGHVTPLGGTRRGRWRLRTSQGHVLSFRPEFVIAFEGAAQKDGRPDGSAAR